MKPLRQGQLDSLCGLYAVVNAVRLCSSGKLTSTQAQAVFRAMVKQVARDMARLACTGSTNADIKRYLRVALTVLRERYDIHLDYRYRVFQCHVQLQDALQKHLSIDSRVALVPADRHLTVVKAVHGNLWELVDSWGYKYLHCYGEKVSRQKPLLRTMPELEVFLLLELPTHFLAKKE